MEAVSGVVECAVEGQAGPRLTADPAALVWWSRRVFVGDGGQSPLCTRPFRVDAVGAIVQCAVERKPFTQVTTQLATVVRGKW